MISKSLSIFCDGGSRGNPGEAAYGFVIFDKKMKIYEEGKRIGIKTNNFAEYSAVIAAIKHVVSSKYQVESINLFLDSKLVVEQMSGRWKIKNETLRNLYHTIKTLEKSLGAKVTYAHILREKNFLADQMVNLALDNLV